MTMPKNMQALDAPSGALAQLRQAQLHPRPLALVLVAPCEPRLCGPVRPYHLVKGYK